MSDATTSDCVPGTSARPVDVSERVALLDVLRGFALWGVFISNSFAWFSGNALLPRAQAESLVEPPLEAVVNGLYYFFVNQKFITLFSVLFGLGFSIQLARAEARKSSIVPLYCRRLGVLLSIGVVHAFALWFGDILAIYAVLGFALLLFRQRSNRTVLTWALVLLVGLPLLAPIVRHYGHSLLHRGQAVVRVARAGDEVDVRERGLLLEGLSSGSFWTTQAANAHFVTYVMPQPQRLLWMARILGRFLLGLLAGRLLLLQDVERHRSLFRRLLVWGLVLGVLGNGVGVVVQRLRLADLVDPTKDTWMLAMPAIAEVGFMALTAAYVAIFALLFQREQWHRVMQVLAPVGRMALTNYLLQTVVSLCLYDGWGLGLIGKLPLSHCVALTTFIFALQIPFSHAWLSRFRFGPVEWLWRSLTYGQWQPLRLAPREAPAPAMN
ncbi:DUF418 domain-containing protein [Corallococcus llansteffanensis]|uniref:DUF418 domain-containing protein n=1 Tax=Corallococcus llansteffanensis TaxID=2316731 RepID=A0A3A8NTU5_9BACT|nr:DUF418 domain-containing protein [Corallococcus llansteffanensis]RKH47658.1 DUF418 domain-containing protein [Corallococcus llansteffanensis]